MGTNTDLYEQDFYKWTQATAALVRQGQWHEVDPACLAEEWESLGKWDRRELGSRLEILVMHLLKWSYQLLHDSPSLRPQVGPLLVQQYRRARRRAMGETQLPTPAFPQECPWSVAQVLDDDFWPEYGLQA